MFGVKTFKPWTGKPRINPKVMVLGYSRYDEDYTDYDIIKGIINGDRGSTHTNFIQAVLRKKHWENDYNPAQFWNTAIFYNYNTTFFPGKPRVTPQWAEQVNELNSKMLKKMLVKYKPTHCIVWGVRNWESIEINGVDWGPEKYIANLSIQHLYCSATVDGHVTIFTYVKHPSAGFSNDYWSKVIKAFLDIEAIHV